MTGTSPKGVRRSDGPAEDERTDRGLSVLPEIRPVTTPARLANSHECRDGWLGTEDQPRPCPYCRPHLTRGRQGWRVNPQLLRKDQTP